MASSTSAQGVTVYRTRPIIGPLTTVFTAPPECSVAGVSGAPLSIGFRGQTCVGDALEDESTCWPWATAAAPSQTPPFNGWGFYSPGLSCPAGYSTACDATQGYRTGWNMQYTLEEGETAVGCCPTGFSCTRFGNGQTCVQTASGSVATASCSGGSFVSSGYATFPIVYTSSDAGTSSVATLSWLPVAAPMIQINWRSEDLATATQAVSAASTPSNRVSDPSPSGESLGSAAGGGNSGSTSAGPISPGAIAGAVIAGVVVLFAIAAAMFALMRRRRARGNANAQPKGDDMMKSPQQGTPGGITASASELASGQGRPELAGSQSPGEVSGGRAPVELAACSHEPHAVHGRS